jgi:multidrug efflux pump subunit AcrA (membrane-fusion protein)
MIDKKQILIFLAVTVAAGLLVGCGSQTPTITPVITAPASTAAPSFRPSKGDVTASGVVVPAQQSNLGLALPARVTSVEVAEGETVVEGQTLIILAGQAALESAVSAAEMELLSAQQGEEMALGQAKLEYANALDALDDAQREWTANQPGNRATASGLKDAKADVTIAEKRLVQARINREKASGTVGKAQAQSALRDAENFYYQAVAHLNWLQSEPTDLEQALLDAELAYAEARLSVAEAELNRLEGGENPDELSIAEARLKAAESGLKAAQGAMGDGEIKAPFSGTVAGVMVNPGEAVMPGQVLVTIANLDKLQVETTDLSERDIVRVEVGQPAKVHLEALGEDVDGVVSRISPQSLTIGGDVVYKVTIDLNSHPEDLLWGMSVEVVIDTK